MCIRKIILAICAVAALSLQVWALQSTLTEEKYSAAMKEISLTAGDAEGHIQARYWPELEDDADILTSQFEQVEGFWKERKIQKAANLAGEALRAVAALKSAAAKDDSDGTKSAVRALRGTCQPCHEAFREKTEEGYRIKPGS